MNFLRHLKLLILPVSTALLLASAGAGFAEETADVTSVELLTELAVPNAAPLEELVSQASSQQPMDGFASYYARRFEGRRTSSGHRYHPDKLTAAHRTLPLGTVVRVVNSATRQEVRVTINDRCAKKPFHFIDLSRAAAKKIGLLGKGKIKVVIIPVLKEPA